MDVGDSIDRSKIVDIDGRAAVISDGVELSRTILLKKTCLRKRYRKCQITTKIAVVHRKIRTITRNGRGVTAVKW